MKVDIHSEFTKKLLDHQIKAISTVEKYIKSNSKKHALIKMPTGTGKTVVIGYICNCFKKLKNILVISPSKAVTEQLKKELRTEIKIKLNLTMRFKDVEHIYPSNIHDLVKTKGNTVFISTIKSINDIRANKKHYFEKLKNKIDIVLFDEGHREPAENWQKTIRGFDKKVILLTATPIRNDNNNFDLENKYIYNYPFHNAIEDKEIRNVVFQEYSQDNRLEGFLKHVYSKHEELIDKYKKDVKVIIRFDRQEDIAKAKQILNNLTTSVVAIHESFSNNADLKVFKDVPDVTKTSSDFWLHQNKLIEGIDDNKFSILAIYSSFSDVRSLVQQVGRIIRKNPYVEESLVIYRRDQFNQGKMFKEYLNYEKRLEKDLSLITFNYDEFFNKILEIHPPILHMNKRFLERAGYLREELSNDLLKKFQLPLKTNVYSNKEIFSNHDFDRISQAIIDNIVVNERGKIIYELSEKGDFTLIIVYSVYRNSPYLVNNYFLEPKLGITFFKIKDNFLFYYDSNDIICDEITNYNEKIDSNLLEKLFDDTSKFKQLTINNGFISDSNIKRQILFSEDMDNVSPSITDKYKLCTTIYGTVRGNENRKRTRYVGFSNSRISDSSHLVVLGEYIKWVDYLAFQFINANSASKIFERYAPITSTPDVTEPVNILLDLSEEQRNSIFISHHTQVYLENLVYRIENNEFKMIINEKEYKITISYNNLKGKYILEEVNNLDLYIEVNSQRKSLIKYLNKEQGFQIITRSFDRIYIKGNFYKLGIDANDNRLKQILVEYETRRELTLNEKGKRYSKENLLKITKPKWDYNSLFYLVSSVGRNLDPRSSGSQEIITALKNVDYLICTDLGAEIADFVAFNEQEKKIYFIHCKAHSSELSATAFQDVCGQIVKNLEYVNPLSTKVPKDIDTWKEDWKVSNYCVLKNRMVINPKETKPQEIWSKIKEVSRHQDSNIYVWALLGNMFSENKYFNEKQKKYNTQKPEIIQIDYLLMSTWSAVQGSNAQFKIYFDKK
ncbi:DEAD/DEAH box helicase family protein [Priestia megaterium]|uniref:DEAD/DEAH box helicase n=1 Tax=Priestia megaterium TaxID=1404 RepID=UPI0021C0487C|nr:DEAD/DEAH box helicase family protein [Priestia megaterium]MCT9853679.1 DEAD/DEAH box helicase family protein [Priestia megaterium]MDF1958775.1 DEAD/DEAH box helicase family protein [Priestia megaterium]